MREQEKERERFRERERERESDRETKRQRRVMSDVWSLERNDRHENSRFSL